MGGAQAKCCRGQGLKEAEQDTETGDGGSEVQSSNEFSFAHVEQRPCFVLIDQAKANELHPVSDVVELKAEAEGGTVQVKCLEASTPHQAAEQVSKEIEKGGERVKAVDGACNSKEAKALRESDSARKPIIEENAVSGAFHGVLIQARALQEIDKCQKGSQFASRGRFGQCNAGKRNIVIPKLPLNSSNETRSGVALHLGVDPDVKARLASPMKGDLGADPLVKPLVRVVPEAKRELDIKTGCEIQVAPQAKRELDSKTGSDIKVVADAKAEPAPPEKSKKKKKRTSPGQEVTAEHDVEVHQDAKAQPKNNVESEAKGKLEVETQAPEDFRASQCACGHLFEFEAVFCLKCGARRPSKAVSMSPLDSEPVPRNVQTSDMPHWEEQWRELDPSSFQP